MNYGLYLSASGVLTNLYRQDVFANNLANVETVGFKADMPTIRQRDPESVEERFGSDVSKRLLDRLGGGVLAGPQHVNYSRSPLQPTGGPLDVALDSPDTFFAVGVPDSETGETAVRLTRDGRFSRDPEGYLVTLAGGHRVLDTGDKPILLSDDAAVTIDDAGRVLQNGEEVSQLQVTEVTDKASLAKTGQNLFGFEGTNDPRTPAKLPTVRSGFVEASGVDPIKALTSMISATKAVTANGNMIRYHDLLMDRAVNVLGRVA